MSKLDRILVLHGPNLNLLGQREPDVYGRQTLSQIDADLSARAKELDVEIECFQSNHEGELVDRAQEAMGRFGGILINPAGFTHSKRRPARRPWPPSRCPSSKSTSPTCMHVSPFVSISYISPIALGVISGLGAHGYLLGLEALAAHLRSD